MPTQLTQDTKNFKDTSQLLKILLTITLGFYTLTDAELSWYILAVMKPDKASNPRMENFCFFGPRSQAACNDKQFMKKEGAMFQLFGSGNDEITE